MQAVPPQGAIVGQEYTLPLTVTGGTTPYTWHVIGDLPPGLRLQAHAGKITGVPTTPGVYQFNAVVVDSSVPQMQIRHEYSIHVIEGLTVEWQQPPKVHGNNISGSTLISNQTGNDFDLTVIIVAVNEYGRATALGYQHFNLAAGATSEAIPFGSIPGMGTYYVRVDAVAHRPGKKHIYRASLQTTDQIKVTQF